MGVDIPKVETPAGRKTRNCPSRLQQVGGGRTCSMQSQALLAAMRSTRPLGRGWGQRERLQPDYLALLSVAASPFVPTHPLGRVPRDSPWLAVVGSFESG